MQVQSQDMLSRSRVLCEGFLYGGPTGLSYVQKVNQALPTSPVTFKLLEVPSSRLSSPSYARVPRTELSSLLEQWPLEGPQTWEQRKWRRIERSRAFTTAAAEEARRQRA